MRFRSLCELPNKSNVQSIRQLNCGFMCNLTTTKCDHIMTRANEMKINEVLDMIFRFILHSPLRSGPNTPTHTVYCKIRYYKACILGAGQKGQECLTAINLNFKPELVGTTVPTHNTV